MIKSLVHIVFLFAALNTIAQNDTINQVDEEGRKQGYWIIYGKDHSSAKVPPGFLHRLNDWSWPITA